MIWTSNENAKKMSEGATECPLCDAGVPTSAPPQPVRNMQLQSTSSLLAQRSFHHMNAGEEQVLSTEKAIYEYMHEGLYDDLAAFLGEHGFRIHALIDYPEHSRHDYEAGWSYSYGALHTNDVLRKKDERLALYLGFARMVYTYEGIKYETMQNISIGNNAPIVCRPIQDTELF